MASQTRETPDSVPVTAIANRGLPSSRSFSSFCRTKSVSFCDNEPPVESRKVQRRAGCDRERASRRENVRRSGLQRAGVDRRGAGVGVGGSEDSRAGAILLERAGAGDHAAESQRIGSVDRQGAVVRDVADDRSARAAVAELQRAAADRGPAGIRVGPGEDQRSRAGLAQRAGAEDIGGERERVGEIGDDAAPVVDRGGIDRARQPAGAEMERAGFANAGEAERIDHAAVGNRHASIRAPARIADRE